ncbi:MAG: glycosyltransferase family 4 protein [Microgenomates group bacterium]
MKFKGKILVFCPYYPPHVGGLESHADEFNKHLSERGCEITVFTPRLPSSAPEQELRYKNVNIVRFPAFEIIPNWFLPKFWQKKYKKLVNDIYQKEFDIIISRTRFFFTSIMALSYARKRKIKWMHIEHGSDFVQLSNSLHSLIAKLFDYTLGRQILKKASVVVANSKASAVFCKKIYRKRNYQVIYRGIEVDEIEHIPPSKDIVNKYKGILKIIFTGRLIDGKGVGDLVNAVSKLRIKNWILFIIGIGPQINNLETQTKELKISDKVIFFGQNNKRELIGTLKASDILVNPSYTEGLPTSVIEAAICEKPIIATNVGGTKEIIGDNSGILIPARNPSILAEKIEYLSKNQDLRIKMGHQAKIEIQNKFNWDNSIDKYIALLK